MKLSPVIVVLFILFFVVNLALISWAITDLMSRDKVKYLSKLGWIVLIALLPYASLFYLIVGRDR